LRIALACLLLTTTLLGGGVACAQEVPPGALSSFEFKVGVLAHDVPNLWSGFQLEKGIDINVEALFGSGLPFLGGRLRPALGASVNTEGYTSKAYLDARWEIDLGPRIFFGLGLGAAVHDGKLDPTDADRKALGSRVLFHVPVELGLRLDERHSLSIYFEHTSNGNTAKYNEALDNIGLRYGIRF
jgi:lipid A 3-O-deacylase